MFNPPATSWQLWKSDLKDHAVDEIAVSADCSRKVAFAESDFSRELLLNGFHGEIGAPSVDDLEECDLGISS